MRARRLAVFLFGTLLLLFWVITACGGGGGLSLEEYFQRLQAADDAADARFDALETTPEPGPEATEEEVATVVRGFVEEEAAILADFVDAVRDIDPPSEAEDAHDEGIEASEAVQKELQEFADGIPDALTLEEAQTLFTESDPELEASLERFNNACLTLQTIADANNIAIDLECEQEG